MMATRKTKTPESFEIALDILGYREGDEWVALALDMDLRGYGATFGEAIGELYDLMRAQISFALFKGQPGMIWSPAEPIYFKLYEAAKNQRLHEFTRPPREDDEFVVRGLPLPPPMAGDFAQADA